MPSVIESVFGADSLRATSGPFKPHDDFWYQSVAGIGTTVGINVTPLVALQVAAVFACVKVISETLAGLPLVVYRRLPDGGKERATDHPLYSLLHDSPNDWMTSFEFIEDQTGHAALHGNCYAEIVGEGSLVEQLIPYRPEYVTPEQLTTRRVRYAVQEPGRDKRVLNQDHVLHVRGRSLDFFHGLSTNVQARDAIALARAVETYAAKFFANDAMGGAPLLEHPGKISKEAQQRLKDDIKSWVGLNRAHAPKLLEEGMKLNRLPTPSARETQMTEQQEAAVLPICRFYRMPPHKIQHLLHATFSNIEHQGIEFATDTMTPWARRWEQRINATLILDREFFAEFLFAGLLRGDNQARAQFYQQRFNMASMSPNDIRRMENENPINEPWADDYYLQGAMVPAARSGEFLDRRMAPAERRQDAPAAAATPTRTNATASPDRAFRVLIADAADRIARAESRSIEQRPAKVSTGQRFTDWLAAFYREHAGYIVSVLTPLANAWEEETGRRVQVKAVAFAISEGGFTADGNFDTWRAARADTVATAIHQEFDRAQD